MNRITDVCGAFKSRVQRQPGGCWRWTGTMLVSGYGVFTAAGVTRRAHRAAYELFVGAIPDGLELDHVCRHRWCVNPEHLEPVSHIENMRRSPLMTRLGDTQRAKTHCPSGHRYSSENTRVRANGHRVCRTCHREREAARRHERPQRADTY